MSPEASRLAGDCAGLAHQFGDKLTCARTEGFTGPERQAFAAKAMMILAMLEEKLPDLKRHLPRSAEEGQAMAKDLREVT